MAIRAGLLSGGIGRIWQRLSQCVRALRAVCVTGSHGALLFGVLDHLFGDAG
jgi:hypothetical protein